MNRGRIIMLVAVAALMALCHSPAPAAQDVRDIADEAYPLIRRDVLFGNPDRAAPRLSPNGDFISYLAADEGVLNVWVAPRDDLADARAITSDRSRGVRSYFWAYTNQHIIFIQDDGGDENWRVYSVNINTRERLFDKLPHRKNLLYIW